MDAEWVALLLIQKFQALLLDGEVTITNTNLRNQVQEATSKLNLLHQSIKVSRNEEQTERLLHAFYSTEDAADTFLARALLLQRQKLRGCNEAICQPFRGFKDFRIRFLFTVQIKKFMSLIEHDVCNNNIAGSSVQDGSIQNPRHQGTRRASSSYLEVGKDVVGLGDQAKELEEHLICTDENIQAATHELISVAGERGSGKTTLVRIVYEKVRIKKHFKYCIWVNVSNRVVKGRDVVLDMLKQVDEALAEAEESVFEQELVSRLGEVLRKDRYLVVVDNVGEPGVWERLQNVIPNSENGSRIVVTTRNMDVAAFASTTLQMGRLSNEESWELFLKKVCSAEDALSKNLDLSLITFKEKILKLCNGLPLLISLMGGILSMVEMSNGEWSRVIEDADNLHGDILALSYKELPSRMKPCFLYMGMFPKGFEVPVRRLFQLWIAERLVTPSSSGELGPGEVEVFLEELINRNMIEVARWRSHGIPKTCRMPGAIYDVFSPKAAAEIGLFYIHCKSNYSSGDQPSFPVRRLASYLSIKNYPSSDWYIRSLRSYISFSTHRGGMPAGEIGKFLNKMILSRDVGWLTILDLEGVYKPRLPESFQKLLKLKYLGLRSTSLESLPVSVCDLPCLETLDVKHTMITSLPGSIWTAKNLQHLYMDWIRFDDISVQVSSDSEALSKLQTLWGLSISQDSPILDSLFNITSLRKLALRFSSASQNRLNDWISKKLTNLQSLRLRSIRNLGDRGSIKLTALQDHQKLMDLYLLGVLPRPVNIKQLPPNLKILTLSMSQLRKDPMRTLGQLPYLNILRLLADSYMGEELTCYQGGFPQLHVLKLWKLMELRGLNVKEGAMPCVKQVEIRACRRLEKVEGLSKLTTLKELMLTDMPSQFANKVKENMGADVFVKENEWKSYPFLA
ncbi:DISEASE RESISTANCE PROTEIN RP [Salix koriyanagi]|uniref:DISEASE RESISTANCE PROTEIN RP n=1 Tax=Salix koriyanagi TaxID=2511006 RepID=A0A9Q0ZGN8_9ROSI|nr:DISEASE RESISTANCE PROTEIN RP [Salix koriyanagi]